MQEDTTKSSQSIFDALFMNDGIFECTHRVTDTPSCLVIRTESDDGRSGSGGDDGGGDDADGGHLHDGLDARRHDARRQLDGRHRLGDEGGHRPAGGHRHPARRQRPAVHHCGQQPAYSRAAMGRQERTAG